MIIIHSLIIIINMNNNNKKNSRVYKSLLKWRFFSSIHTQPTTTNIFTLSFSVKRLLRIGISIENWRGGARPNNNSTLNTILLSFFYFLWFFLLSDPCIKWEQLSHHLPFLVHALIKQTRVKTQSIDYCVSDLMGASSSGWKLPPNFKHVIISTSFIHLLSTSAIVTIIILKNYYYYYFFKKYCCRVWCINNNILCIIF